MSKRTKIWLMTATSLVVIGCIILAGVMTVLQWDFTKLSTVKYETNRYGIYENYENISIVTDTADIVFVPSENANTSVVCYEQKHEKHSVAVKDGTLVIEIVDTRKWYEWIGISIESPKITVYIPQGEYGALSVKAGTGNVEMPENFKFERIDVSVSTGAVKCMASASEEIKITTTTGDIRVENAFADSLDLSVSTGEVIAKSITCAGDVKINVSTGCAKLADVTCKNMTSNGRTGDISLKNVIAAGQFLIERSTGDVKFDGCDASGIFVKTSTGSVNGSLLSDKVFITQTRTGSIDVPKTVSGGRCEITTDTGSIKITVD